MPANKPKKLGKYAISDVLGRGGMGVVYQGYDPNVMRTVAIKTIHRELLEEDSAAELVARFKNEAQAAGRLSHPGIVGVYDYGEEDTLAYIVMEYVQGYSLDMYFKQKKRFTLDDIVSIMAQLLDALDYAHGEGVVHRDIKPSNIIIMNNGKLKLADFGIARISARENLTQFGAIMGTPGYIAPEQYQRFGADPRVDIFSAGVIFYQLLCGKKPFAADGEQAAAGSFQETPVAPSKLAPERGYPQFDPIVLKALATSPADRFQTAREFSAATMDCYHAPPRPSVSGETTIQQVFNLPVQAESSNASGAQAGGARTATTAYPPHWDAALLRQVEEDLAHVVGPIAKMMVKKAAKATSELDVLYQLLARELDSARDETKFLATRTRLPKTAAETSAKILAQPGPQASPPAAAQPITAEAVEQATRQLAAYIGPIAKVLARKTADKANNRRDFYRLLAENITDEKERGKFLKEVGTID